MRGEKAMFSTEGKLEAYVRRLHSQLDTTTVKATLTLMVSEARAGTEKKRRLIALERLTQRDSSRSLNELQPLEKMDSTLSAALLRETDDGPDDIDEDWGTVVPLRISASNVSR